MVEVPAGVIPPRPVRPLTDEERKQVTAKVTPQQLAALESKFAKPAQRKNKRSKPTTSNAYNDGPRQAGNTDWDKATYKPERDGFKTVASKQNTGKHKKGGKK